MMEIASRSTAVLEPRRRFEYWNDLVSKAVRGMYVVQPALVQMARSDQPGCHAELVEVGNGQAEER
jgi:hypothetical protein